MHNVKVEVDKSLTGVVLAFRVPEVYPGEDFMPVGSRYSYITLQVLAFLAGIFLLVYPKYDDSRLFAVVIVLILLLSSIISMIGMQVTLNAIEETKTLGY
jgi:uncharacterized membrane protein